MTSFGLGVFCGAFGTLAAVVVFLKRRRKVRGRFLALAVHEILAPITAARMTTSNLLGGIFGPVAESQLRWLELLNEQILRLDVFLNELRDFVHLEWDGEVAVQNEEIDLSAVVVEVAAGVQRGFAQAKVPLHVEAGSALRVCGDAERLPRMLLGLLYHARKFRLAQDVRLEAVSAPEGRTVVSVRYQGPPLTEQKIRESLELFDPARHSLQPIARASGLGLGLLRAVARQAGADLAVTCDGQGETSLNLTLPLMLK